MRLITRHGLYGYTAPLADSSTSSSGPWLPTVQMYRYLHVLVHAPGCHGASAGAQVYVVEGARSKETAHVHPHKAACERIAETLHSGAASGNQQICKKDVRTRMQT